MAVKHIKVSRFLTIAVEPGVAFRLSCEAGGNHVAFSRREAKALLKVLKEELGDES